MFVMLAGLTTFDKIHDSSLHALPIQQGWDPFVCIEEAKVCTQFRVVKFQQDLWNPFGFSSNHYPPFVHELPIDQFETNYSALHL